MTKVPSAGTVKTRLHPFLTAELSAALAVCFLRDTISTVSSLYENVIVAFTPSHGRGALEALLPGNSRLVEQTGEDLGERLQSAIEFAEQFKFSPIILIGTDSPTLPKEYIQMAVESFERAEADITLGPTTDGGYYLIGLRESVRGIFNNVAWSTSEVYECTENNAERLGLRVLQLPCWHDIDTPSDLVSLNNDFLAARNSADQAPETARWLISNAELFSKHQD